MAKQAPAPEEGDAPKKKGKLKWIIILLLLAVLGGGGYVAYTKFLAPPAEEAAEAGEGEKKDEHAKKDDHGKKGGEPAPVGSATVTLPTFLVNLADPLGRRYLKMTIDVAVVDQASADEITKQMPRVRDSVIMLLSSKTYADLSTYEAKIVLKKEIVERLNLIIGGAKVKDVFFTDMVIQ